MAYDCFPLLGREICLHFMLCVDRRFGFEIKRNILSREEDGGGFHGLFET